MVDIATKNRAPAPGCASEHSRWESESFTGSGTFPRSAESVETTNHPEVHSYRKVVLEWLSQGDREMPGRFVDLESQFRASLTRVPVHELRRQFDEGHLYFREHQIHTDALRGWDLGRLGSDLQMPAHVLPHGIKANPPSPIILVTVGNDRLVIQGNHRVHKAIFDNPEQHPIFALEFADGDAYQELMEIELRRWPDGSLGTTRPKVVGNGYAVKEAA